MKFTHITSWTLCIVITLLVGTFVYADDEYNDRQMQAQAKREAIQSARIAAVQRKREIRMQMAKWDYLGVGK